MDSPPGVGWGVGGLVLLLFSNGFEVDGGFWGFFLLAFLLFLSFHGQAVLLFTVRGSPGISLGDGGSSERGGNVKVLFWASLYLPFFSVGGFFYTFQHGEEHGIDVGAKYGIWPKLKYRLQLRAGVTKVWNLTKV